MKEGWKNKKLQDVCDLDKSQGSHKNLPYIGMEDIEANTGRFLGSTEPQAVKSSTFKFTTDHVLYGRLRPYLNKVMVSDFDGHCSTEIFPIKPAPQLSKEFLRYWFLMDSTVRLINSTCTGARMPRANMKEVLQFQFPIAPLPEQKRIVAILDEAFAGIAHAVANAEKNLVNARELFESYLNGIFTTKDEGWVETTLGEICQFENGDRGKNYPKKAEYVESGVPWINTGHIQPDGTLSKREMNYISQSKFDSLRSGKIQSGDLVYCLRGATLGKTALVDPFTIGAVASSLVIIRPGRSLDRHYLYYFLTSPRGKGLIKLYDNGAAQPNLGAKSVAKYTISLPPIDGQKVIVENLTGLATNTQRLESIYKQKVTALSELKQSILQKAFAGELTAEPEKLKALV